MKTRKEILEQLIEQNENTIEINKIKVGYYTRQKISTLNDNQLGAIEKAISNAQADSLAMNRFIEYLKELLKETTPKKAIKK